MIVSCLNKAAYLEELVTSLCTYVCSHKRQQIMSEAVQMYVLATWATEGCLHRRMVSFAQ
jgi:hypothetical protein